MAKRKPKEWETVMVFDRDIAPSPENPHGGGWVHITMPQKDIKAGRKSAYYPGWNKILAASRANNPSQAWALVKIIHQWRDYGRGYGAQRLADAAWRAAKVAAQDWRPRGRPKKHVTDLPFMINWGPRQEAKADES